MARRWQSFGKIRYNITAQMVKEYIGIISDYKQKCCGEKRRDREREKGEKNAETQKMPEYRAMKMLSNL